MSGRLAKLIAIAIRPRLWKALASGVAPGVEHIPILKRLRISTLVDVGANKGQFSSIAKYVIPDVRIIAFEPLADAASRFRKLLSSPDVELHRVALGSARAERTLHVADRSDSSSLFPLSVNQTRAFGVKPVRTENVPVEIGADVVDVESLKRPILLKIDVQGGELSVLQGFENALHRIDYIYVELSYVPLYEGQPLAAEIVSYLARNGFMLAGVMNQVETSAFGMTQGDFLFRRHEGNGTADPET